MRHAYIGPLDGGSGRGEVSAIFLITKISYVFCTVWVPAICLMTTKCNLIFGGSLMKYYRSFNKVYEFPIACSVFKLRTGYRQWIFGIRIF